MSEPVDRFEVDYHGTPIVFTRLKSGQGYGYQWPPHGAQHWIDTESGTRHKLSFNAAGKATIVGSLAHENFHVVITDGVANDA